MDKFKSFKHLVVFDGTSTYVIPSTELDFEIEQNDVSILYSTNNIEAAQSYSDVANEEINN